MTKQEIYDKVCAHLAKQKRQSKNKGGACVYRGPYNRKCAIGALIPDEVYEPAMDEHSDGIPVQYLYKSFPGVRKLFQKKQLPLLDQLQACHDDSWSLPALKEALQETAKDFGIKPGAEEAIKSWER